MEATEHSRLTENAAAGCAPASCSAAGVRFKRASLRLPTTPFPGDDTPAIIEATKLYVETWVVPLLDSIESGDMTRIKEYYEFEQGDEMKPPNDRTEPR